MDIIYAKIYDALDSRDYMAAKKYIGVLQPYEPAEAARLLVSLYIEQGDSVAAFQAWQELASLEPEDFYTAFLHARILYQEKRYVSAWQELQKIVVPQDMRPGYGEKIANLRGQCCKLLGRTKEAAEAYKEAAELADEPILRALEYSNYLFNLHYSGSHRADFLLQAAKGFNQAVGRVQFYRHEAGQSWQQPWHIGYIAADFRRHVLLCFSYALLTAYDREHFSVYVYMLGPEDAYSRHLQGQVTGWRNLQGKLPAEAAKIIRQDGISILVDLAGHTKGNGLPILAYKPAPVQISGIGYFASTGLNTMDYFLGDRYLDGEDGSVGQPEFTEELIVLPHSHFCYCPLKDVPLPAVPAFRRNGYVTFGSFNNFAKVTDEVLDLWGNIMAQVPDSRLLLKAAVFDGGEVEAYTRKRLIQAGLPMERVECRGISEDYLAEYGDMDIALDTFPYPGGGTSCDALYMGRPLITLKGGTHGERFGYSLLMNLGLGELVADSAEGYIERAVMLAQNPELLADLQQNIRSIMEKSPLMDSKMYLADMECAYRTIAEKYASVQPQLTYREQKEEEKYISAIIDYLDKRDGLQAQSGLEKLRLHNAQYYYLQSEVLALKADFTGSDRSCMLALKLSQTANDGLQGAIYHRLAENAKQRGQRETAADDYLLSSKHKTMEQGKAADYSNYLLNLNYVETPAEKMLAAAKGYGQIFAQVRQYDHGRHPHHDKLRIGYISPDFCRHVVAAFSQAFFRSFDPERFAVYAYADCEPDDVTQNMMAYPVNWRNVHGLAVAEKAARIYQDEVDILVDLSGHTGHSALPVLAYKPAPLQLSGIGYFATTGLEAIDYFLTDIYTALPSEDAFFTEGLLRLPHSHLCYTPLADHEAVQEFPCQRHGYVTFGTMNQWDKITDTMLQAWGRIMQQLPNARLLLKAGAFDKPYRLQEARQRVLQAGIEPERVAFQGYTEDYWRFYAQIDIALDSYPYPGGGSTCDALYMGVPVVSLYGKHHHGRFGCSLLQNSGLGELAAATLDDYVNCAIKLASDREHLQALQKKTAAAFRQGPVMDEQGYMRDLEGLYQMIWRDRHEPLRADVSGNV